jgi:hypothetical protein
LRQIFTINFTTQMIYKKFLKISEALQKVLI